MLCFVLLSCYPIAICQHVCLDGIYKLMTYRIPLWLLCSVDEWNEGFPAAGCIAARDQKKYLVTFLTVVLEAINAITGMLWEPLVRIDMDRKEKGALAAVGMKTALCNFHTSQTINKILKPIKEESVRGELWTELKKVQ